MLVLVAAAVLFAPLATANAEGPDNQAAAPECAEPPCGYITPIIDLVFPDKLDCGTGAVLGAEPSPADCLAPPTASQPVVMQGTLRWYWDASYEGTYPADPSEPIEISFGKTSTHPSWIDFSVEPSTFTIDNVALLDPTNFIFEQKDDGTVIVFFWFEEPITVTFSRTGEPSQADIESMNKQSGVQQVFVKVKSTSSGTQFKESYGIELFKFHGANDPDVVGLIDASEAAPAPGLWLAVPALLAAAIRRR